MSKFNTEMLHVNFGMGTSETKPIIPRKYTLTHSDTTGELFLTIAAKYDYAKITDMRDEVLAEWIMFNNEYQLMVNVMVDKEKNPIISAKRNNIFIKELPLALQAIIYGDREFFRENPFLYKAPIYVKFNSVYPMFNRLELWGTPSDYKL
ncbi:staygreen family protein [Clostridium lacusfryxellense]|uniref:staygreen family protein n=1 Tax=Clostridium lacusfryxellense TaxID=205328 RepID=UPI001C0BD754|nr:staygreen family protein [Clostridium lacusfryxellense]MBU3110093.1 staygreen family protein [Clostridium lacusfryxellense]